MLAETSSPPESPPPSALEARKRANEQQFRRDFAERVEIARCRPVQLEFETTSRCNIRCLTCPKTYAADKGADANRELFARFADALFEAARSINLTGFGEPMFSPHFEEFYQRSIDAELHVGFVTNGTYFDQGWMERFIANRTHLFVSVDCASQETMKVMRPHVDFARLRENLLAWGRLRRGLGEAPAHMYFNLVPTLKNIHELPQVVELAHEAAAERVEILTFWTEHLEQSAIDEHLRNDPDHARRCIEAGRARARKLGVKLIVPPGYDNEVGVSSAGELAETCDAPLEVNPEGSKYPLACSAPWFRIHVGQAGDVKPCCRYPWFMGNLAETDFETLWNNRNYRAMRRRLNSRFPQLGCKECRLVWGITAGNPEAIFARERGLDRLHTGLQRLRRDKPRSLSAALNSWRS